MTVKELETRPAEDGESIIITNPDEHLGIQIQGPDDVMNDWELFTLYREEDDVVRLRREGKVVWASNMTTADSEQRIKDLVAELEAGERATLVRLCHKLDLPVYEDAAGKAFLDLKAEIIETRAKRDGYSKRIDEQRYTIKRNQKTIATLDKDLEELRERNDAQAKTIAQLMKVNEETTEKCALVLEVNRAELEKSGRTLIATLEENGKLREERDKALGALEARERDLLKLERERDRVALIEKRTSQTLRTVRSDLEKSDAEIKRVKGQRDALVVASKECLEDIRENDEVSWPDDLEKALQLVTMDDLVPELWERQRGVLVESKRALEKELQLARDASASKEKQLQATQETASRIRAMLDRLKSYLEEHHGFTIGDAGYAVQFTMDTLARLAGDVERLKADDSTEQLELCRRDLRREAEEVNRLTGELESEKNTRLGLEVDFEKSKRWAETLDETQKEQAKCIRRRNDQRVRLQTQITELDTELEAVRSERDFFKGAIQKAFSGRFPEGVYVLGKSEFDELVPQSSVDQLVEQWKATVEEREEEIGGWALGHIELAKSIYRLRRELQLRDNQLQSTWDELVNIERKEQFYLDSILELLARNTRSERERNDLERQNQALRMQNGHVEPLEKYLFENHREDVDNGETAIGNAIRLLGELQRQLSYSDKQHRKLETKLVEEQAELNEFVKDVKPLADYLVENHRLDIDVNQTTIRNAQRLLEAVNRDNDATIRSLQNLITERDELLVKLDNKRATGRNRTKKMIRFLKERSILSSLIEEHRKDHAPVEEFEGSHAADVKLWRRFRLLKFTGYKRGLTIDAKDLKLLCGGITLSSELDGLETTLKLETTPEDFAEFKDFISPTTPDEILPSGTARFVVPVSGSCFLALRRGGTSSFNDPSRKLQIDLVPDWTEDFDPIQIDTEKLKSQMEKALREVEEVSGKGPLQPTILDIRPTRRSLESIMDGGASVMFPTEAPHCFVRIEVGKEKPSVRRVKVEDAKLTIGTDEIQLGEPIVGIERTAVGEVPLNERVDALEWHHTNTVKAFEGKDVEIASLLERVGDLENKIPTSTSEETWEEKRRELEAEATEREASKRLDVDEAKGKDSPESSTVEVRLHRTTLASLHRMEGMHVIVSPPDSDLNIGIAAIGYDAKLESVERAGDMAVMRPDEDTLVVSEPPRILIVGEAEEARESDSEQWPVCECGEHGAHECPTCTGWIPGCFKNDRCGECSGRGPCHFQPKDRVEQDPVVEALAGYAHDAWSGWMRYLFNKSELQPSGEILITNDLADRWSRQIETPYAELPEDEKESDRKEARKMLDIVQPKDRDTTVVTTRVDPCSSTAVSLSVESPKDRDTGDDR
jgi:hypothetical protein